MSRTNLIALIKVNDALSTEERSALGAAIAAIPDADVGELAERDAMGMTTKEMILAVSLSITANFATDAIKDAIDASGLTSKVVLQTLLPDPATPAEPGGQDTTPKAAPPRDDD